MRSVREWASTWTIAEILAPSPPLWLGGALLAPVAMMVVALGAWTDRSIAVVVALTGAAIAIARIAEDRLSIALGSALTVIAIHLGVALAVTRGHPSVAVSASVPIAIAAMPLLLKVWGMSAFAIDVAITVARHRARVRAWLAAPDDRGLHVQCTGMSGRDIIARVKAPGAPRDIVITRAVMPGRGASIVGREYILFDAIVIPEPRSELYRDLPGERVESTREVGWTTTDSAAGEVAVSAVVVIATHAALLAVAHVLAWVMA